MSDDEHGENFYPKISDEEIDDLKREAIIAMRTYMEVDGMSLQDAYDKTLTFHMVPSPEEILEKMKTRYNSDGTRKETHPIKG